MPEHWKDAAYENLRAEGAFLVSAIRKGGETRKVEIKKLANEKCILVPNFKGNFKSTLDATKIKEIQKGVYQIDILKGESVIFYKDDADLKLEIAPCEVPADQRNIWGLKAEN